MKKAISAFLVLSASAWAQTTQRQAVIRGGGSPDSGKCTIEVVVDGAAEVSVQGTTATLRTTSGQPAQWRRFECTSAMPVNLPYFHFAGVDGRGRQDLIRDPRNGGPAVVAIYDPDPGAEGYTFDLTWGGASGYNQSFAPNSAPGYPPNSAPIYQGGGSRDNAYRDNGYRDYPDNRYRPGYQGSEYYRRYGHGFAVDDAINACRDEVYRQARQRFRSADVHIRRTDIDDNPGRDDWVLGSLDVHRGVRAEQYNFSCSVNFDNGRVRSAQIEGYPIRY